MFHYDFFALWSAARLIVRGGDPYDAALLAAEMYANGWPEGALTGEFRYPFWTIWFFAPFGLLERAMAQGIWLVLTVAALGVSVVLSRRLLLLDGARPKTELLAAATLCFFPFIKLILFGQTTFLVLLGVVLSAYFARQGKLLSGGLALSLTFLKPHLLLPWYAAIFVWGLERWRFAVGALVGLSLQCVASWLVEPSIATRMLNSSEGVWARTADPALFSIPAYLAEQTGSPAGLILSVLAACIGSAVIGRRFSPVSTNGLAILLPLSMLSAVYAWSHDYVVIFPAYIVACACLAVRSPFLAQVFVMAQFLLSAWALQMGLQYERYLLMVPMVVFVVNSLSLMRQARAA